MQGTPLQIAAATLLRENYIRSCKQSKAAPKPEILKVQNAWVWLTVNPLSADFKDQPLKPPAWQRWQLRLRGWNAAQLKLATPIGKDTGLYALEEILSTERRPIWIKLYTPYQADEELTHHFVDGVELKPCTTPRQLKEETQAQLEALTYPHGVHQAYARHLLSKNHYFQHTFAKDPRMQLAAMRLLALEELPPHYLPPPYKGSD